MMRWRETIDRAMDAAVVPGYTTIGYEVRRRLLWSPIEESLEGRTVVVSGATAGLGKATAAGVASLGARTVIIGRDPVRTAATRDEIAAATGADVVAVIADLSLMKEVRAAAEEVAELGGVHVLINNVGTLFNRRTVTGDGIEATLATDLLGHFVLTNALVPALRASAPTRVINVVSGGMFTQRLDVGDLQSERGYRGSVAYARAKRGQMVLTRMWAERLRADGIVVHAVHPGWADTPGVRTSLPRFRALMRPILRTSEQSADTIVWLAAAREPVRTTGLLWHDRAPRSPHRTDRTRETGDDRRRLWSELERLAGDG